MKQIPEHETVRKIMDEVYNRFYLKWRKNYTQDNAADMLQEARELNKKYDDCDLCRQMLIELVSVIEASYMKRSENNGV